MFPVVLLVALGGLIAWSVRPKKTGVVGNEISGEALAAPPPQKKLAAVATSSAALPPLKPQAERLLALLVLFARDKKNPAGRKQYLSLNTAREAVALAKHLGLHKTARAIQTDGPVPADEYLPGRTVSVRESVVAYGTTGKA